VGGRNWRAVVIVALVLAALCGDEAASHPGPATRAELQTTSGIDRDEVVGAFTARSYVPRSWARVRIWARTRRLTFQVFACGVAKSRRNFYGAPVTEPWTRPWRGVSQPHSVSIRVRGWPSGLHFLRLTAQDGRIGYAPFIVRPRRRATFPPIAVVLPTNTWQAYNFRDMDGNGIGDTWYADPSIHVVNLSRPYTEPGMPRARLTFIRWLYRHGITAHFYADDDFGGFPGAGWLASRYRLIVFAGHEEYVTPTQYDLTTAYRNRGGNLMFVSANNFFYRVTRSGDLMYGRTRWRDIGRPEAALVGVQYVDWWERIWPSKPYVVKGARTAPWFYAGTGLRNGDRFGRFGIEIDARTASSPSRIVLLARIKDIFGPGKSAEMTYYSTGRGARVFAAGVLNFGTRADLAVVDKLLENAFVKLERH
jgi:hypothetical protein